MMLLRNSFRNTVEIKCRIRFLYALVCLCALTRSLINSVNCKVRIEAQMHEIITLQLGQRANYLGTHFWNIQVSMPKSKVGVGLTAGRNHTLHTMKGKSLRWTMMFTSVPVLAPTGQTLSLQGL